MEAGFGDRVEDGPRLPALLRKLAKTTARPPLPDARPVGQDKFRPFLPQVSDNDPPALQDNDPSLHAVPPSLGVKVPGPSPL